MGGSFCSNTSSSATSPTRELWPHAGHCRREVQLQSRETREKQSTTRVILTHCRDMLNEGKRDVLHPLTQTSVHSGINLLGLDRFERADTMTWSGAFMIQMYFPVLRAPIILKSVSLGHIRCRVPGMRQYLCGSEQAGKTHPS